MAGVRPYISKRQRKQEAKATHGEDAISDAKECLPSKMPRVTSEIGSDEVKITPKDCFKDAAPQKRFLPKVCICASKGHKNAVNCIRWNNSLSSLLLSASMDSTVGIWKWSRESTTIVKKLEVHNGAVKDAKWNNDGTCVLSGGYDKTARITDVETGKERSCFKHNNFVTSVAYHPDSSDFFLSGTSSDGIFTTDSRSGKQTHHYKTFFGQIQDLLFHPDGKTFFSAAEIVKRNSLDKAIIAWDFQTTAVLSNQISQEAFGCSCLQNHPIDQCFLAQFGSGYITIFSNSSPYKLNKYKRYEGHQTAGFNIRFCISPDGNYVISGDIEGQIHAYDYRTARLIKDLPAYSSACMDVAFHPTLPSVLASCSWDGEVSFWE